MVCRQAWQCSIITGRSGELLWFCQLAVPYSLLVTMGNFRHKIEVVDIPLGWRAVVTNDLCIKAK